MAGLVVPGALIALFAYSQGGNVSWAVGLPMALGGVLSVSWGVLLAHKLPAARLRQLFCLVLLGTAAAMLLAPRQALLRVRSVSTNPMPPRIATTGEKSALPESTDLGRTL